MKNKEKQRKLREIISDAAVCSSDDRAVFNRNKTGPTDYYHGSKDGRVKHFLFSYCGPWFAVKHLPIHLIEEMLEAEWLPLRPISPLEALSKVI